MAEDTFQIRGTEGFDSLMDKAKVEALVYAAVRDMLRYGEAQAKRNAPRKTGNLLRNIGIDGPHQEPGRATLRGVVGVRKTAPYAKWVEHGTGIFGVFKSRIYPKTGNLLVWKDSLTGHTHFAGSVKGQKGQHYMRSAYRDLKNVYVPARVQLLKKEIAAAITDRTN